VTDDMVLRYSGKTVTRAFDRFWIIHTCKHQLQAPCEHWFFFGGAQFRFSVLYTQVYISRISGLSQILCCPGSRRISWGPTSTRRPSKVATKSLQSLSEHLLALQ